MLLIIRELMTAIAKVEDGQSESETLDPPARLADLSCPRSPVPFTLNEIEGLVDDRDRKKLSQRLPCHYFDYIAGSSFGGWESRIYLSITALTTR